MNNRFLTNVNNNFEVNKMSNEEWTVEIKQLKSEIEMLKSKIKVELGKTPEELCGMIKTLRDEWAMLYAEFLLKSGECIANGEYAIAKASYRFADKVLGAREK